MGLWASYQKKKKKKKLLESIQKYKYKPTMIASP